MAILLAKLSCSACTHAGKAESEDELGAQAYAGSSRGACQSRMIQSRRASVYFSFAVWTVLKSLPLPPASQSGAQEIAEV